MLLAIFAICFSECRRAFSGSGCRLETERCEMVNRGALGVADEDESGVIGPLRESIDAEEFLRIVFFEAVEVFMAFSKKLDNVIRGHVDD